MIGAIQDILHKALERLGATTMAYLPPMLAAVAILLGAYLAARLVRWGLNRLIKAANLDSFLRESGLASMFDGSGRPRAAGLLAAAAFWAVMLAGCLTALSAFDNALASHIIESLVFLLPKLFTAALILLAGVWLGRFLGRGMLVWACNEDIPYPRRAAAAVRVAVIFVAVVVAADHLNFARSVFLAAFVIVAGGAALALAIALGAGARGALDRLRQSSREEEKSIWNHV